jgi:predicted P-loop ATPase/GTPase
MSILVVSDTRIDAGKTTFSTGLLAHTGAVGFKPRAGNDHWHHHDQVRSTTLDGRLHGKDARRLAAASPDSRTPEAINAIHRLWRPTPGRTGLLGQDDRDFVLDRVGDRYVRNATVELPSLVRENLPVEDAIPVETTEALNEAIQRAYLPVLESLAESIGTADRAVVESYANVARPIDGLDPEAVAVLDPGQVRIVDGERFYQGCSLATGTAGTFEGSLEERVPSVMDLIDPVETVELPALPEQVRSDPEEVADAYGDAYARLLDVAGW